MKRLVWFHVLCICFLGAVSSPVNDFEARERQTVERILHLYKTNRTFAKLYDEWEQSKNESCHNPFPCKPMPPSDEVPTSVHKLRPGDIKVVGAIGDSLTAARGAKLGVLGLLTDFPEVSWSIGGECTFEKQITLPNIIRKFNPDVIGASVSNSKRMLNTAESGAKSDSSLNETIDLVEAMKNDKRINFEKDWKVITVFIGGNDLCAMCNDYEFYSPKNYIQRVQQGIDYLWANCPRTFVNLVAVLNVEMVQELGANLLCDTVHSLVCSCAAFPKTKEAEAKVLEYKNAYQRNARKLATLKHYNDRDDFAVVFQPFYTNTYPPYNDKGQLDLSYFGSDCFHLSTKGQQAAGKALWNNMVEPVGSKRLDWHPHEPLECPTKERPYFFTSKNSQ